MKTIDIINCYTILKNCLANNARKIPSEVYIVLLRNFKKLGPVAEDIDTAQRPIMEKYAKKDEDGNIIFRDGNLFDVEENVEEYGKEWSALLQTEIEVIFDKMPLEALKRCDEERFDPLTQEEIAMIAEYMLQE